MRDHNHIIGGGVPLAVDEQDETALHGGQVFEIGAPDLDGARGGIGHQHEDGTVAFADGGVGGGIQHALHFGIGEDFGFVALGGAGATCAANAFGRVNRETGICGGIAKEGAHAREPGIDAGGFEILRAQGSDPVEHERAGDGRAVGERREPLKPLCVIVARGLRDFARAHTVIQLRQPRVGNLIQRVGGDNRNGRGN